MWNESTASNAYIIDEGGILVWYWKEKDFLGCKFGFPEYKFQCSNFRPSFLPFLGGRGFLVPESFYKE
jgi:hypothetical protein